MTDGPQKSLPMNNAWKRASGKLANVNSALGEATDAVLAALIPLVNRGFVDRVQALLSPVGQGTLFAGDPVVLKSGLLALEAEVAGSTFARSVIDCCAARIYGQRDGSEILTQAVAYALAAETTNHFRGMAEHWSRKAPREAGALRRRCGEALRAMDFDSLARHVLSPAGSSWRPRSSPITDINAGVPL